MHQDRRPTNRPRRAHPRRLLLLVVVGALVAAACGSDPTGSTATTQPPPTPGDADAGTTTQANGPTIATSAPGVTVRSGTLGATIVDEDEMTLYVFDDDQPGESRCLDECAEEWPPLLVAAPPTPAVDGIDAVFGSVVRPDGSTQLSIDDRPLYRYSGDRLPGDTQGHGVGGSWFAVSDSGETIAETDVADGFGY